MVKILTQPKIDSSIWLLMVNLMQVCNKRKRTRKEERNANCKVWGKWSTRNFNVETKAYA